MVSLGEGNDKTPRSSPRLLRAACTTKIHNFVPNLGSPAPPCSSPAAIPWVFADCASSLAAGAQLSELGGWGRGRALSRPDSPGNILKSIQKFCAARAKRKYKRAQPPTPLGIASPDSAALAAPPAAALSETEPSAGCCLRTRRGALRRSALLFGAPCLTTTHSASPRHRRSPRTPPGHRRRARPGASAKRPGRCWAPPAPEAAAAAAAARGRPARVPRAKSLRGCPSARGAGTTATRRRSRATSASACGGTASARSAT